MKTLPTIARASKRGNPVCHLLSLLIAVSANVAVVQAAPVSGIDKSNIDTTVRAQDDFYRYVNGNWLKQAKIPGDKSRWGSFDELRELSLSNLRGIIEGMPPEVATPGSEAKKIVDAYASFTNETARDALGLKPLEPLFMRIAGVSDKKQLAIVMAELAQMGVSIPFQMSVNLDGKDSSKYAVQVSQSGLGLPDRDYYLNDKDEKNRGIREKYVALIAKTLARAGESGTTATAGDILTLETELAKAHWTRVENRDPVRGYNKVEIDKLSELAPGFEWKEFTKAVGYEGKTSYFIVRQPGAITGFAKTMDTTALSVWKAYLKWHVLNKFAQYLDRESVADNFGFFNTVLRGVPDNEPVWKRGVRLIETGMGEAAGKLYVQKYFPPQNKVRMEKIVANLIEAYRQSIDSLDWMSPATKKEAQAKLATFRPKIGYTEKWRDYSALTMDRSDLIGNVQRMSRFDFQRNLAKLGKLVDRTEWGMTPQTVNASYSPPRNEITFPAAILQPPFFNADADDAVNYGGIGAVIGHEIGHGFDDSGSQYDGAGNLRNWWTPEDREKYLARTKVMVAQYDKFSPVPGYFVNGSLTLGENIGDNSGAAIAYKAYLLSLGGKPAPVIDGFTGTQRFFIGFGQIWRNKARDDALIVQIKTDPHTPGEFRANGTVRNQPGFYEAFGVKAGDKMFVVPEQRVTIW